MKDNSIDDNVGFLTGKILVATPNIQDQYFRNSVIYIISHGVSGAIGVAVNITLKDIDCDQVFNILNINLPKLSYKIPIHLGGPVEAAKGFILHTDDYTDNVMIINQQNICLSSDINLLHKMVLGNGPKCGIFLLGYTGWQPGQVEAEISNNNWLIIEADYDIIFGEDNSKKWQNSINKIGIDATFFSPFNGNA